MRPVGDAFDEALSDLTNVGCTCRTCRTDGIEQPVQRTFG